MSTNKKVRLAVSLGVFVLVCAMAALADPQASEKIHPGPWFSVIPPLLAVLAAVVTQKIFLSLGLGVVAGGVLAGLKEGGLTGAVMGVGTGVKYVVKSAIDPSNLMIIAFVIFVLSMIMVLIVSGGMEGVVRRLAKYAKGARSTQAMTFLMGLAVFIDDYANTMIVGAAMRPLSDRDRVSREKLAFLVDATSAPIAGLAVVSTWVGYQVSIFQSAAKPLGLGDVGYGVVFDAIPFRFYCLLMIVFVVANIWMQRDFGPMHRAEKRARKGKLVDDDAEMLMASDVGTAERAKSAKVHAGAAVLPLLFLFTVLFGGLWIDGGGLVRLETSLWSLFSFSAWREVISASENSTLLLCISSGTGLLTSMVMALTLSRIQVSDLRRALWVGFKAGMIPAGILILSWSLKSACDGLNLMHFLVGAVGHWLTGDWLPVLLFVLAGLTAFSTGSSWGTMAILIPTALPIAVQIDGGLYGGVTVMAFAAILDGAIFGDHCSPISDTTIMSSISTACDHLHHVRTQIPYAVLVAAVALGVGYLPASRGMPAWGGFLLGAAILVAVLRFAGRRV